MVVTVRDELGDSFATSSFAQDGLTTSFDKDVFISYSSHDKSVARRLFEQLTHDGLTVWFDEHEIQHIEVTLTRKDGYANLCVADNGQGITAEFLPIPKPKPGKKHGLESANDHACGGDPRQSSNRHRY